MVTPSQQLSLGEHCEKLGITVLDLEDGSLPILSNEELTKGIMIELNNFRRNNGNSWNEYYAWITRLCGCVPSSNLPSVKAALSRINKKQSELLRNKHLQQLKEILCNHFLVIRK